MRLMLVQVVGLASFVFIIGYASDAVPTESEGRFVGNSRESDRRQPIEAPVRTLSAEELIDRATDGASSHASDAAAQLVIAGSADPEIVALLLRRLEAMNGRPAAIAILARIGNGVTPQALALLNDERSEVRWSALRLLLCIDNLSPSIAPQIARCLKDDDVCVRRWAAMLLAQVDNEACVVELMTACRDDDAEVRWRALRALHQGQPLSNLPESLRRDARADADPDVRFVASHLPDSAVVDGLP